MIIKAKPNSHTNRFLISTIRTAIIAIPSNTKAKHHTYLSVYGSGFKVLEMLSKMPNANIKTSMIARIDILFFFD
jgi:hypothetical protein